jgi:hypothetical protein
MIRSAPNPPPTGAMPVGGMQGGDLPPVVAAFLERLRRLPLGAWAEAGRRLEEIDRRERETAGRPAADADTTVRTYLRQVVNEEPRVAAQARQRVLDLAAAAQGFVHPAEVSRMKKAALAAVLALVARPALGEERFAEIYEPFATLIPLASLSVASPEESAAAWRGDAGSAGLAPGG